jgi:phosphoenolpyruvate carboxylase
MEAIAEFAGEAKEHLLREDRRLLGRLLGETIRDQVGAEMLDKIERIRQTAVAFRRDKSGPGATKTELERLLNALDIEQTLHVVRAFSFFSHLLNIAEDTQQNRRRRAHDEAGSPPRRGSLAYALDRLRAEGLGGDALLAWFARARVSPVLTRPRCSARASSTASARSRGCWLCRRTRRATSGCAAKCCGCGSPRCCA